MTIEAEQPRARTRIARGTVAEVGAYAVAIVLIMAPGLWHARTQVFGAGDDARYYTWLGWRIGRLLAHGHVLPTRVSDVIAPFGLDLRLLDGYLPSYVSGVFNLVCGPTLAINLTYVTGAILNVVAARSLVRKLTDQRAVHVLATIAFLSAPPIALNVQLGLLPLFWAFTVPLLVGDAIDVVTERTRVRPIRLAVLLALAYLCSVYFLVFGGIAYGAIVLVAAIRRRSWRIPLVVAGAVVLAAILLSPFIVPRLRFDHNEAKHGGSTQLLADSEVFSADALSIVAQPRRSTFILPRPTIIDDAIQRLPDPDGRNALEETIFPGLMLLAGLVLFLRVPDRRRMPLGVAALVLWILSLGPSFKVGGTIVWKSGARAVSWLPYRILLSLPALGSLRVPVRVGLVLTVVFVAMTAIVLDRFATRWRAILIASVVLLAINTLIPLPTTTMRVSDATKDGLREIARLAHPGETVMRVPSDCEPSFATLQIFHHAPVVGCTGSFAANPWRSKMTAYTSSGALMKLRCDPTHYGRLPTAPAPAAPFSEADLAQLRTQFGVRFVILDRSLLAPFCGAVTPSVPFLEAHRLLSHDDRYDVLDLSMPAG